MTNKDISKKLEYCASRKCELCQKENGSGFPLIDGRCYGMTERMYEVAKGTGGEIVRLVDVDKQLEWVDCMTPIHGIGLEPVVAVETVRDLIKGAPTIDAITVSWMEDQIAQHTSETGWTDWWADMCRRFLQEYERRRDDEKDN